MNRTTLTSQRLLRVLTEPMTARVWAEKAHVSAKTVREYVPMLLGNGIYIKSYAIVKHNRVAVYAIGDKQNAKKVLLTNQQKYQRRMQKLKEDPLAYEIFLAKANARRRIVKPDPFLMYIHGNYSG